MGSRVLIRVAVAVLTAVLVAIGVIYLVTQCQNIPAPLPRREAGSTAHRVGYAAVAFALAALLFGGGSYLTRSRARLAR